MSANLITGNLYSPILASQDSDYQAGLSGNKTLIMPVGNRMALDIEDANTIRANDGVIVTKEGRRIQIDNGAVEEWSIPTGTQGTTSYYLIGFKLYTTDESAEICETFVEKVNSATDTITENTFRGGATEIYISVGRITQVGLNIDTVESLIEVAKSMEELASTIDVLNNDLSELKTQKTFDDNITLSNTLPFVAPEDCIVIVSAGRGSVGDYYLKINDDTNMIPIFVNSVYGCTTIPLNKDDTLTTGSGGANWANFQYRPFNKVN